MKGLVPVPPEDAHIRWCDNAQENVAKCPDCGIVAPVGAYLDGCPRCMYDYWPRSEDRHPARWVEPSLWGRIWRRELPTWFVRPEVAKRIGLPETEGLC